MSKKIKVAVVGLGFGADFANYFPYVVKGGLMAFHDVTPGWDGCWRAWHEKIAPCLTRTDFFSTIGYGYKP